jgi:cyclic pyranopterin phosphate synthase
MQWHWRMQGVRRINVSLDSRDPEVFRHITRHGDVRQVLDGIAAARVGGAGRQDQHGRPERAERGRDPAMLAWTSAQGIDLTLIETMPMGRIDEDRADRFVPLTAVFDDLSAQFDLTRDAHDSGGPARYWRVGGTGARLGLISPLTGNFCDSCNRVRLTTEGKLFTCLGHDDQVDLKAAIRSGGLAAVDDAIDAALAAKPARHSFDVAPGAAPAVSRHMSVTGG